MKRIAISVKQPWAYLICTGIKDIENRTWKCPMKHIGKRVFIHASGKPSNILLTDEQAIEVIKSLSEKSDTMIDPACLHDAYLSKGFPNRIFSAFIGSVEITDCVINHESIWAEKTPRYLPGLNVKLFEEMEGIKPIYNWVLKNPILFDKPILNVKGKLSFWDCSEHLVYPEHISATSPMSAESECMIHQMCRKAYKTK